MWLACQQSTRGLTELVFFYVFNIYCCNIAFHIYIFILYLVTTVLASVVLVVLLTLSHKSPVVRPSIAQRADGWYRLKVRAYGITSCALPLFGGSRSRWLTRVNCNTICYDSTVFCFNIHENTNVQTKTLSPFVNSTF